MELSSMIEEDSSTVPDILDIENVNECAVSKILMDDLLKEYNPELEDNYNEGREVDIRVWALIKEMEMMIQSPDVWFVRQY
jgi:hypothetical protein|tara:strand:- start:932 stop:1174 length:243 start_codon:yes stop_codon:yes gene_type:complete